MSIGEREEEEGDFLEGAWGASAQAARGAAAASTAHASARTETRLARAGAFSPLFIIKEIPSSLPLSHSLSLSLRSLELEGQRQKRRQAHAAHDALGRRKDDVDVAALVPQDLAACPAGRGGRIGVRYDSDRPELPRPLRDRLEDGGPLTTHRQPVRSRLDVAPAEDRAVLGKQGGAHPETGVRSRGVFARFPRRVDEAFLFVRRDGSVAAHVRFFAFLARAFARRAGGPTGLKASSVAPERPVPSAWTRAVRRRTKSPFTLCVVSRTSL